MTCPRLQNHMTGSHDSNVQILMCLIMKFMNFLILNAEWSIFYIKFYFPYFFNPFKWSDLLNTSKSIVWKKENVLFSFYLLSLTMLFLILFLSCNTLMRKISLVLGYIQVLNQTNLAQLKISITWSCWLFPFPTPQTQGDNQLTYCMRGRHPNEEWDTSFLAAGYIKVKWEISLLP